MGSGQRHRAFAILAIGAAAVSAGVVAATGVAAKGEPGGSLSASGQVTDKNGASYGFELNAEEFDQPGVGSMFLHLTGPGISVCDVHGPSAEPGSTPMTSVQCGGSGGISVSVDDCTAVLETHGFVHADHPHTVYLGTMTVDVEFRYDPDSATGRLTVEIFTPKDVIEIKGETTGTVAMDTCT
ncbi:MAG: hypothetical protein ACRDN6_05610 [Gaiellaceae bacterium]